MKQVSLWKPFVGMTATCTEEWWN